MNGWIRGAAALVFAGSLCGVCFAQGDAPAQTGAPPAGDTQAPGDAGPDHGRGAARQACQDDIAKFCSAEAGGHGAFRCLREHQDTLSDSCKTAMAGLRGHRHGQGGWSHGGGGAPDDSPGGGAAGEGSPHG